MRPGTLLSTRGLARASAAHPWRTVAVWLVIVALSGYVISTLLSSALTTEARFTNGSEAKRAAELIDQRFAEDTAPPRPNETIVISSQSLTVDDPGFRQFVRRLTARVMELGPEIVEGGFSYYQAGDPSLVSDDRQVTIIPLIVTEPEEHIDRIQATIEELGSPDGFSVYTVGNASINKEFNELAESDLSAEFRVGIPAAMVVLLLVFSAIVAALIPLVLAFVSIAMAVGLTALIGQAFPFSFFVTNMITMMGLAVGIDYSLFILSRYREERRRGLDELEAITAAGDTASRAVLFSGTTVVLALLGMFLIPTTIFRSLAGGAILVVVASVLASLTLLPAILGILGDRVNRLRLPVVGRRFRLESGGEQGGFWDVITRTVMRRPVISLTVTAGVLIAASIPTLDMDTGFAGVSTLPDDLQSKKGFMLLQEEFDYGGVGRASIVLDGEVETPAVQDAIAELQRRLETDSGLFVEGPPRIADDGTLAVVPVAITGDPNSQEAEAAIRRLRDEHLPDLFSGLPAEALVTGPPAFNVDFFDLTARYTPVVFGFVLGLSFVLLTVVFRSLVVPIKAIIMNLLSVGAAYGLMVLVSQQGWGAGFLGFQRVEAIEAWIPLFLFSILFGLSMDYHVFLLSRIRERYDETGHNDEAVAFGLRTTAGIITGAALIMVAVFAGFASGELVMFQQVGFGLAAAILLDATIVRSILVPSTMKLLGRGNWYLPRLLHWLPDARVEGVESGGERDRLAIASHDQR